MNRRSPVWAKPITSATSGSSANGATVAAIAAWNSGDVASWEVVERNSTMMLERPASNSVARRSATLADSELGSSQPAVDSLLGATAE